MSRREGTPSLTSAAEQDTSFPGSELSQVSGPPGLSMAFGTHGGGREGDGGGWKEESKVALFRHTDGHQVHEEVLNVTNHQGSANQNHSEILPDT